MVSFALMSNYCSMNYGSSVLLAMMRLQLYFISKLLQYFVIVPVQQSSLTDLHRKSFPQARQPHGKDRSKRVVACYRIRGRSGRNFAFLSHLIPPRITLH